MALTQVSSNKCAGGYQKVFEHDSSELQCKMKLAVYLPPKAESDKCPVFYWLSGLTCTEQNFITKAGAQQAAADNGIIIVAPDTSPRGCGIEGEDEGWDFGTGAGFYVDATQEPWKTNYRMYSYVTDELPKLINANFPTDPDRMSISGHSMGGHGALVCTLRNPGKYKAVSAFAPICNPIQCPWGQKAFSGYLGADKSTWESLVSGLVPGPWASPVPVLQPAASRPPDHRLLRQEDPCCFPPPARLRPQLLLHLLLHERPHQAPHQVPQRLETSVLL